MGIRYSSDLTAVHREDVCQTCASSVFLLVFSPLGLVLHVNTSPRPTHVRTKPTVTPVSSCRPRKFS